MKAIRPGVRSASRCFAVADAAFNLRLGATGWRQNPHQALAIPNPRIQIGVGQIYQQIHQNNDRRQQQIHLLHDRIISLIDGHEHEAAHPRQAKDGLEDHRPAGDLSDLDADDGGGFPVCSFVMGECSGGTERNEEGALGAMV
jgi:hypothetical protein